MRIGDFDGRFKIVDLMGVVDSGLSIWRGCRFDGFSIWRVLDLAGSRFGGVVDLELSVWGCRFWDDLHGWPSFQSSILTRPSQSSLSIVTPNLQSSLSIGNPHSTKSAIRSRQSAISGPRHIVPCPPPHGV